MISIDIAILTLNEEKFLQNCIESILNFENPDDLIIKIYIIDGGSSDRTLDIARTYVENFSNVQLLHNKGRIQSTGMNLIIKESTGDYIMRIDAHTIYDKNYLKDCIETSLRTNADNVGGILTTLPGSDSYGAKIVQALTSHRFGVGNSSFRISAQEGLVDTVPYGFFKRSIFESIGLFDERLLRAQDYEFNRRITNSGGLVWINPKIHSNTYNQPTLLRFLIKNILKEGPYNAYMWYIAPYTFSLRHSVTAFFSLGVLAGLAFSHLSTYILIPYISIISIYFTLAIMASIQSFFRYKLYKHILLLPIAFFIFHFLHGIGVLVGIFKVLSRTAPIQVKQKDKSQPKKKWSN